MRHERSKIGSDKMYMWIDPVFIFCRLFVKQAGTAPPQEINDIFYLKRK